MTARVTPAQARSLLAGLLSEEAPRAPKRRRTSENGAQTATEASAPLTIELAALAPSVNHLYKTARRKVQGRMVPIKMLSENGEAWYALAVPAIREQAAGWRLPDAGPVGVTVRVFGLPRNADLDNLLKGTLDACAQALGFDDARIHRLTIERAGPSPRRTVVTLEAL